MADWQDRQEARLEQRRLAKAGDRDARVAAWHRDHEADLERRRLARAAERQARADSWQDDQVGIEDSDVAHERDMAERMGITVVDFRRLQAARRAQMQGKPQIGYAPDHEVR